MAVEKKYKLGLVKPRLSDAKIKVNTPSLPVAIMRNDGILVPLTFFDFADLVQDLRKFNPFFNIYDSFIAANWISSNSGLIGSYGINEQMYNEVTVTVPEGYQGLLKDLFEYEHIASLTKYYIRNDSEHEVLTMLEGGLGGAGTLTEEFTEITKADWDLFIIDSGPNPELQLTFNFSYTDYSLNGDSFSQMYTPYSFTEIMKVVADGLDYALPQFQLPFAAPSIQLLVAYPA